MHIGVVSTSDRGGGAERVALDLARGYQARGHRVTVVVGRKYLDHDGLDVREIPPRAGAGLGKSLNRAGHALLRGNRSRIRGDVALERWLGRLTSLRRLQAWRQGHDEPGMPGDDELLSVFDSPPDVLHLHNLHGWYFDLQSLDSLSRRVPCFLTLHDEWLYTGHCAYTLDCDRWREGCGQCPRLSIYPAIHADGTAANWQARRELYTRCDLHLVAPSTWLLQRAEESILQATSYHAIPNGLDTALFHVADAPAARAASEFDLDPARATALSAAAAGKRSMFKDHETLEAAIDLLADHEDAGTWQVMLVGVDSYRRRVIGRGLLVHEIPYRTSAAQMAQLYQCADVYIQTTKADNYPRAIQEAMGCGVPVVASDIGGIPELVTPGETGYLVPVGDASAVADAVATLLRDDPLRAGLGAACRRLAESTSEAICLDRHLALFAAAVENPKPA